MKLPYSKFFWRDYQSDTNLRSCSLAARGLWMDLLCIMAQSDRYGYLTQAGAPMDDARIARLVGSTVDEVRTLRAELLAAVVPGLDGEVWFSRRLVREYDLHQKLSAAGKKGGNPALKTSEKTPEDRSHIPVFHGPTPPLEGGLSLPLKPTDKPQPEEWKPITADQAGSVAECLRFFRTLHPKAAAIPTTDDPKIAQLFRGVPPESIAKALNTLAADLANVVEPKYAPNVLLRFALENVMKPDVLRGGKPVTRRVDRDYGEKLSL